MSDNRLQIDDKIKVFQGETFEGNATITEVHHFDEGSIDTWHVDVNFDSDDEFVVFSRFVRYRDKI